ncbi:MAG TPA: DUF167 domain-containing protein [Terriglobales bacterium]|nr:DUF167 domain-containing protein [Terriglobales bacterium]
MFPVNETAKGAAFAVKVQPRARKNAITGMVGNALKLAVTAPPVNGKANQAVIEFFADWFEIPRSQVTITSGETSRNKLIRVTGVTAQQLHEKLAAAGLE